MITIEKNGNKIRVTYPGPIETEWRDFKFLDNALDFIAVQLGGE